MSENGTYTVTVNVKNIGKCAGKEVVQLYVSAPNNKEMNKPVKELKAFAKTKELKPGESELVTMTVAAADLASFDIATSSWVVDAGKYEFLIGASSRDIRAKLEAEAASSSVKVNNVLNLPEQIELLKR